jgi:hypothetical protein
VPAHFAVTQSGSRVASQVAAMLPLICLNAHSQLQIYSQNKVASGGMQFQLEATFNSKADCKLSRQPYQQALQ